MFKRKFITVLLIISVAALILSGAVCLAACNAQISDGTLIVGTTTVVDTLNRLDAGGGKPGYAYTMLSSTLAQVPLVYRSRGEFLSVLCDIDCSDDGLSWTFKLKDGFIWHDGVAVCAEDLSYTLKNSLSENDINDICGKDGRVTVRLKQAKASFLNGLVSVTLQPKHILEGVTKDTITDGQSVIGCGPFCFVKRDTSAGTIEFRKFEDYPYAESIEIERVIFRQFGSEDSMRLALKAGELDMLWDYGGGLDANAYSELNGNSKLKFISYPTDAIPKVLFFNNGKLTDVKVKEAIKRAIDYGKIARIFGTPHSALPREGFVAPHVFGYKQTAELKRDLTEAKRLLREAGYSERNKFDFELLVRASGDDSQYADLIKTDLEETGMIAVRLIVKGGDWQSYYQSGAHTASLAGITAAGYSFEAGYGTRYMLTTQNSVMQEAGFIKNPVGHGQIAIDDGFGKLTEFGEIRQALADAQRADGTLEAAAERYQDYFVKYTPAIALMYDSKIQVMSDKLTGAGVDDTFGILNVQSFVSLKKRV